jgi:hypothetical protein
MMMRPYDAPSVRPQPALAMKICSAKFERERISATCTNGGWLTRQPASQSRNDKHRSNAAIAR